MTSRESSLLFLFNMTNFDNVVTKPKHRHYRIYGKICIGEQPRCFAQRMTADRRLPLYGGDSLVTFEALTCMFTLGLLIVAIIALQQK